MFSKPASVLPVLVLALLIPCVTKASFSPTYNQIGTTTTTLVDVKTDFANSGTQTFILFGDGYFALGQGNSITRQHNYSQASSTYTSTAYFVEKYKSDPPTARTATINTGAGSSTYINPDISMPNCSRISNTWSPAPGNSFFTILSIKNDCNRDSVDGTLKYYFNNYEQTFSTADLIIYNSWISSPSIVTSDDMSYTHMLIANYTSLRYNEVRHIYINVRVPSTLSVGSYLNSKLLTSNNDCCNTPQYASVESKQYPHDPNSKVVDKAGVCFSNLAPHGLTYTISFQNDGQAFAQDIYVDDILESRLDPLSAVLTGSSAPCTLIAAPPMLHFTLPNIFLPGSNQTVPHIYTYDETCGSLRFYVETIPCLAYDVPITNKAIITFDTQVPIATTVASTEILENICPINCLGYANQQQNAWGNSETELKVSPNPGNSVFEANFMTPHNWEIHIFDAQGKRQWSNRGEPGQQQLSIPAELWPPGIYFLHLQHGQETSKSRLIKI